MFAGKSRRTGPARDAPGPIVERLFLDEFRFDLKFHVVAHEG